MLQKNVSFYTKPGCTLCDEALLLVNKVRSGIPFHLEVIDISHSPVMMRTHGLHVPVVLVNGIEAFRYHVDAAEFRTLLLNGNELGNNTPG